MSDTPTSAVSSSARAVESDAVRVDAARIRRDRVMIVGMWIAAALALLPLIAIVVHLLMSGASALSPAFFVRTPTPAGVPDGGMANAIVGTCVLLGIAIVIGVPIGLGAGLYCAEERTTRLAQAVRFVADVLSGLPSIVTGIVVWELVVRPAGHFSAYAGGLALGLLMIPMVTRATEDMVRLVPRTLVEAAYALGFARWRTATTVLLRTALPGIVTASLVAIARAAGETAPLLFTAFGNPYWSVDLGRPIAALPLQIYAFAQSPYEDWRSQAALGALVLVVMIALLSLTARSVLAARARFVKPLASDRPATIDIERAS